MWGASVWPHFCTLAEESVCCLRVELSAEASAVWPALVQAVLSCAVGLLGLQRVQRLGRSLMCTATVFLRWL